MCKVCSECFLYGYRDGAKCFCDKDDAPIPESKRKIVQISNGVIHTVATDYSHIFALCDDGTLWSCAFSTDNSGTGWVRLPEIPQGDE